MTARSGWTINGTHFCQTWTRRRGVPTLLCFIDGKIVAMAAFKIAYDAARNAETAATAGSVT